jgi:hypothetical protein
MAMATKVSDVYENIQRLLSQHTQTHRFELEAYHALEGKIGHEEGTAAAQTHTERERERETPKSDDPDRKAIHVYIHIDFIPPFISFPPHLSHSPYLFPSLSLSLSHTHTHTQAQAHYKEIMGPLRFASVPLLQMVQEQKQGTYTFLNEAATSAAQGDGVGIVRERVCVCVYR